MRKASTMAVEARDVVIQERVELRLGRSHFLRVDPGERQRFRKVRLGPLTARSVALAPGARPDHEVERVVVPGSTANLTFGVKRMSCSSSQAVTSSRNRLATTGTDK